MNVPVPTMSADGWVTSENTKLVYLLSHYFANDAQQDVLHSGHIYSIREDLAKGSYKPSNCAIIIKPNLETVLQSYFDHATVQISSSDGPGWESTLLITATCSDNGAQVSGSYTYNIKSGAFARYLNATA